jgi:hypothetical protein
MTAHPLPSALLLWVLGLAACNRDDVPPNRDSAQAAASTVSSSSDTQLLGAHRPVELVEAATTVVGLLRGEVEIERIRLADTVSLYLGREEGGTRNDLERERLRDPSNWSVLSDGLRRVYSFVPPARPAKLTTRVGRHLDCLDYPLSSTFPELARFPHVGTTLMYGTERCLQSWNLTFVFDPDRTPATVIAVVYDQWEW